MNEIDQELLGELRTMAREGPREAPDYVEQQLVAQFRKHHRRRHLMTWALAPALAAAAAGIALLAWPHQERSTPVPVSLAAVAGGEEDADAGFYPLPEAEALPAVENAMVVRVQLPVSSLELMGVPVGDERADSSVQAELLLGQDGLARGVRLAQ
jgi:predicted anti-sigma-YlaC factor YlaD